MLFPELEIDACDRLARAPVVFLTCISNRSSVMISFCRSLSRGVILLCPLRLVRFSLHFLFHPMVRFCSDASRTRALPPTRFAPVEMTATFGRCSSGRNECWGREPPTSLRGPFDSVSRDCPPTFPHSYVPSTIGIGNLDDSETYLHTCVCFLLSF